MTLGQWKKVNSGGMTPGGTPICCCDFGGKPQRIDVRTYGFGNGHFWHGHQISTSPDWFCADGERVDSPTCGSDYCEIGGGDDES